MTGKCAKCGKHSENIVELLWCKGPNGNRRYKICDRCRPTVERDNQGEKELKK